MKVCSWRSSIRSCPNMRMSGAKRITRNGAGDGHVKRKLRKTGLLLLAMALALGAQQSRKLVIDSSTDPGRLLEQIVRQSDLGAKQTLMEQFVAKYPSHAGIPWVVGQLQAIYLRQEEFDAVVDAGQKALAVDPDDVEVSFQNLKAAEGKHDPDLVKSWAVRSAGQARKIEEAQPAYARQVELYAEYALYSMALQSTAPVKTVELVEALERMNSHSQYVPKAMGAYLNALRQTGQAEKAGKKAEVLADALDANEDVLIVAADSLLQKKTDPARVVLYSNRAIDLLSSKPEKQALLALANWMAGLGYSAQGQYEEADKALRAALPGLTDPQVRAAAYFHLGKADYELGKASKDKARLQEALTFTEQASAVRGPLQAQAQKNLKTIRGELNSGR